MSHLSLTGKSSGMAEGTVASPRWTLQSWHRVLILTLLGCLLGRASIEHVVSPFGLAYFVILSEVAGRRRSWPAYAAIIGAWSHGGLDAAFLMCVEFLLYRLTRRLIFRAKSPDLHWIPITGGLVAIVSSVLMVGTVWTKYDLLLAFADGALVMVLCLIFIQCMAIFVGQDHSKSLRYEQIISLIIMMGSVVTGFSGITWHSVSFLQIALDWIVLMLACGGMGISAASAIVLSMLAMLNHSQSLADVGVLAFAGLLAGLLKDAHKFWVGIAFLLSTSVLSFATAASLTGVEMTAITSAIAVFLYFLTPKRLHQEFSVYVPGTDEHKQSERQRVQRINLLLTEKINKVGQVFEELAVTFADNGDNAYSTAQQLVNHVVGSASKQVCSGCPRQTKCWDKEGFQTYQAMVQTVAKLEENLPGRSAATPELRERCVRLDSMLAVLKYNLDLTDRDAKWIAKLNEYKTLVSAQLAGVASVVKAIAGEIEESNKSSLTGEEQILAGLEQLGLYVDHIHIVNLEPGKVEIEITQPTQGAYEKSARVIAPLLSGIVGENITVSQVTNNDAGPCTSKFTSARLFKVKAAVSTVARDGRVVSGDTHTSMDLGNGKFAIAVSDGMGNGERARRESKAAIDLLKKLLKAGFDEQLAIRTVNSTLLLRSRDEMFTTLDMALIDLFTAKTEFLKIGSAPSYVRRGSQVYAITGANVPIGILQDIEVQSIEEQLRDGDILILMSDGIYDAPQHLYDKEDWLKKQVERLETIDPQEIADTLLEAAVRMNHGQILDDMTVMVAIVVADEPEWATIKLPSVTGLKRHSSRKQRGA